MDVHKPGKRRNRTRGSGAETVARGITDSVRDRSTVEMNSAQVQDAIGVARSVVTVSSVLEKILGDTVCAMNLWMTYNGERIDLAESEQRIIETMWPRFVREALWYLMVVGVVVVGRDRHNGLPFVVPYTNIRVMFREGTRTPREYWAEEVAQGGAAIPRGTAQRRRLDALVFAKYHPDEYGHLTSPGCRVVRHAVAIERILSNQQSADYQRTHPIWTYQPSPQQAGAPDPTAADRYFEGELAERWAQFQDMLVSQQQNVFQRMNTLSQSVHQQNLIAAGTFANYSLVPDDVRRRPPFMNHTFVPLGMQLVPPILPQQNSLYQSELEMQSSLIMMAFSVPPMVMPVSHAVRYAAQPEQAMAQWADTVRNLQQEMTMLVSEVYNYSNADLLNAYALAMLRSVAELKRSAVAAVQDQLRAELERKNATAAAIVAKTQATGDDNGGVTIPPPTSPSADSAEGSPRAKRQRTVPSAAELIAEAADGVEEVPPPTKNEDGELQFDDTGSTLKRHAAIIGVDDTSVLAYVLQRFRINVEFHCRPTFTMEQLQQLVEANVMSLDDYARLAADLIGVRQDAMLTSAADREKEAKQRATMRDAAMTDAERQKAAGATAKPGAAAKSNGKQAKKRKAPSE